MKINNLFYPSEQNNIVDENDEVDAKNESKKKKNYHCKTKGV